MSVNQSTFPTTPWDGLALTKASRLDDKIDFEISDQQAAEIIAIQNYILAYVDLLRLVGGPNTIIGVNAAGTGLEYKSLLEGDNITITHAAGSITISAASGGSETPYNAEADSNTVIGSPLYIKTNTHVDLARANDQATTTVAGLAKAAVSAGAGVDYATEGKIVKADWTLLIGTTNLTPGALYYVSEAVAGQLTSTPPSTGFIVSVGRAINTTTLDIEISKSIRL